VFGTEREGTFGPPPGEYNFGAAVNITNPNLGFNAQLNRIANDFGVQQWWQYVGQLVINELFRIQAALVSGDVDRRIYSAEVIERTEAQGFRPVPDGGRRLLAEELGVIAETGAAPSGGSNIVAGVEALRSAGGTLMQRVAQRMGLTVANLIDGLRAGGVAVPGSTAPLTRMNPLRMQQQQQPAPVQPAANLAAATASNQKLASLVSFANGPEAVAADGVTAPAAPKMAAQIGMPNVPAGSMVISQSTNESEGDAGLLAQLNQNLAADRAAVVKTAAQDQMKQPERVAPVAPAAGRK
jgi:hypothetical protein